MNVGKSTEPYSYLPLKDGEIRLLELLPSNEFADPILCRLHHVPIDRLPAYNSLSYPWGTDVTARLSIFIKGKTRTRKTLMAMPNLEAFLRQHRQDEAGNTIPLLWIDAVCINQEDLAERRQQIGMMCRLYTSCSRLIVWLGIDDEDAKAAIKLLKLTAQKKQEGPEALSSWKSTLAFRFSEYGENNHKSLSKFFSRSWFSRAWIVQEYGFGCMRGVIFKCGSLQFSQKEMEAVFVLRRGTPSVGPGSWFQIVGQLVLCQRHLEDIVEGRKAVNLLIWILYLRRAKATDPRDKVYAILGLAKHLSLNGNPGLYNVDSLIVNYRRSIQDIYSSLVKSLVISTKRVDILLACCTRSHHVKRSWTPDWSIGSVMETGFQSLRCGSEEVSSGARFNSSGSTDAVATFASDLSTMTVRGIIWDTIAIFAPKSRRGVDIEKDSMRFFGMEWDALVNNKAFHSERDCLKRLWQAFLLAPDTGVSGLCSEDDFIALGLNDLSDPVTQTLRSDAPGRLPILHTCRSLEEFQKLMLGRLFLTSKNFIGKVFSKELQPGDLICILLGCCVPVVLRRVGTHYEFIRSVWLDGLMFGEAMEALERGEVELEDFELH